MSRAHAVLGKAIAPRVGFAPSKPGRARVGQHIPSGREIKAAHDAWQRSRPIRPDSGYFDIPFCSSRNPDNPPSSNSSRS